MGGRRARSQWRQLKEVQREEWTPTTLVVRMKHKNPKGRSLIDFVSELQNEIPALRK